MIREILNGDFMDCREVQRILMRKGMLKKEIRDQKRYEQIQTLRVVNEHGEEKWLWYDPASIWEKYDA